MSGRRAKRGLVGGSLLAATLLVVGCSTSTTGKPVAVPGAGAPEPSFPTARPSLRPTAKPSPSSPSPSPTAPGGAIALPPDQDGYVFIETKSGHTRCQIAADTVDCEAQFTNSPIKDGEHANGVSITAAGNVQWVLGNLGDIPTVTIDYRTYDAQGWAIAATEAGTRFTNNRTSHGMFVSIAKVETF